MSLYLFWAVGDTWRSATREGELAGAPCVRMVYGQMHIRLKYSSSGCKTPRPNHRFHELEVVLPSWQSSPKTTLKITPKKVLSVPRWRGCAWVKNWSRAVHDYKTLSFISLSSFHLNYPFLKIILITADTSSCHRRYSSHHLTMVQIIKIIKLQLCEVMFV